MKKEEFKKNDERLRTTLEALGQLYVLQHPNHRGARRRRGRARN